MATPAAPLCWTGTIPLQQVLDHVLPAYGGDTWAEAMTALTSDPAEAATLADLTRLGPHGFSRPIIVETDEDTGQLRLCNGMHRVTAAHQMGHPTIACHLGYPDEVGDTEYIEITYRLAGPFDDDADPFGEGALTYATDWLRSFPLPDGTWVETDLLARSGDTFDGMWLCPHTHVDALIEALTARSPGFSLVTLRCVTGATLDAEYAAQEAAAAR